MENQFAEIEQIERWEAGEVLFRDGEQPRGVFILHAGTVDMVFSARNGMKKSLRTAQPGEIVGLSDAVSGVRHDCTATTRTRATIGFVPVEALQLRLQETPTLWLTVARFLSADVNACW